jgi:hypothetical protein
LEVDLSGGQIDIYSRGQTNEHHLTPLCRFPVRFYRDFNGHPGLVSSSDVANAYSPANAAMNGLDEELHSQLPTHMDNAS